jgi:hypothetical protein
MTSANSSASTADAADANSKTSLLIYVPSA